MLCSNFSPALKISVISSKQARAELCQAQGRGGLFIVGRRWFGMIGLLDFLKITFSLLSQGAAGYATGAAGYATGAAGYATSAADYALSAAGYDPGAAGYAPGAEGYTP